MPSFHYFRKIKKRKRGESRTVICDDELDEVISRMSGSSLESTPVKKR